MFYVLLDNGAKISCKNLDEAQDMVKLYLFHGPVIFDGTFGNRLTPVFNEPCLDSEY